VTSVDMVNKTLPEAAVKTEKRPVIAVLGGAGRLGRACVMAARARGADVRILTRKALVEADGIVVVTGDATRREDVARTLKGADAVISVVGPVAGSPRDLSSRVSLELLHVARASGPRRVVLVSPAIAAAPRLGAGLRLKRALMAVFRRSAVADQITAEKILQATTLDWTIVRAVRLDDRSDGAIEIGHDLSVGAGDRIGRTALAHALVAFALGSERVRQAVVVRA
jgi:putative NADH-flavin reductase